MGIAGERPGLGGAGWFKPRGRARDLQAAYCPTPILTQPLGEPGSPDPSTASSAILYSPLQTQHRVDRVPCQGIGGTACPASGILMLNIRQRLEIDSECVFFGASITAAGVPGARSAKLSRPSADGQEALKLKTRLITLSRANLSCDWSFSLNGSHCQRELLNVSFIRFLP